MIPPSIPNRQTLLRDLAELTTMQPGTLAEEYREIPAPDGKGTVRLGPYYKHQCWEGGRNLSRRVPAQQVPALRADIANAKRFAQITEQLAALTIAQTRALRSDEAQAATDAHTLASKKNSKKNASRTSSTKPKPSSHKPKRASPRKG